MPKKKEFGTLQLELRKLGLNEKEARVYLVALESGYTSVQNIAKKARISRPTAYKIINDLEKKKLIRASQEERKKLFTAQSPDYLLGIIKREKRELEEKEREFIRIISILRSKYYLKDEKEISRFKAKNGLSLILDDLLTSHEPKIYFLATDEEILKEAQREKIYKSLRKRLGKVEIKELLPIIPSRKNLPYLKRKQFKINHFGFKGAIIAYDK